MRRRHAVSASYTSYSCPCPSAASATACFKNTNCVRAFGARPASAAPSRASTSPTTPPRCIDAAQLPGRGREGGAVSWQEGPVGRASGGAGPRTGGGGQLAKQPHGFLSQRLLARMRRQRGLHGGHCAQGVGHLRVLGCDGASCKAREASARPAAGRTVLERDVPQRLARLHAQVRVGGSVAQRGHDGGDGASLARHVLGHGCASHIRVASQRLLPTGRARKKREQGKEIGVAAPAAGPDSAGGGTHGC